MDWTTHQVFNQFPELGDYDPLASDPALCEALARADAGWARPALDSYARRLGRAETYTLAQQANRHAPELHRFDTRGRRIDAIEFHPAWHQLMALYRGQGLVSLPVREQQPGRWTAWAAGFYLHGQVEQGTLCPATMTQASIPVLRREPTLWPALASRLLHRGHDPSDRPIEEKQSIWVGMGMTEKQGGSDVRANTTTATPRGDAYALVGHKWFFSAPMCDGFLVLAQAPAGLSCFLMPRRLDDGDRNAFRLMRLKDKLGDGSNASSEVEFTGAHAWRVGEEGRGVATIIEMVMLTRLDCMLGSAAEMRMALAQALHHAHHRRAFGKPLVAHALMRNVLADLALEAEAALVFALRVARAVDAAPHDAGEAAFARIATAAGKYWICKRAPAFVNEAQECLGGAGYVEDSILPRLYRQAPLNSIWEGSGNIQCLDVLRALAREPGVLSVVDRELASAAGTDAAYDAFVDRLRAALASTGEAGARRLVERLALALQAAVLLRAGSPVAPLFVRSRLAGEHGLAFGTLPEDADVEPVLARAWPA